MLSPPAACRRSRPTILIVDDLPGNLRLIARILGDGYDTLFATRGLDALALAAEKIPDLILLDVMMPDMDGYRICMALKQQPETKEIPVVFLTAMLDDASEAHGFALGGVDYITKPLSPAIVQARVRVQLELKRCRDDLERLTVTDELTGIANRRRGCAVLEQECLRARRNAAPLSLLMIDVDHFKAFNDSYGHPAGDECLRHVARRLAATARRPADLVARYGGEEFMAILPETDLAGAVAVAENMRQAIAAEPIVHAGSPSARHITLSLGAATARAPGEVSGDALIRHADVMLYRAKTAGRDRTVGGQIQQSDP